MSAWNDFVLKIFHEERKKNKKYSYKQALQDASDRKSEMGTMNVSKSPIQNKKFRKSKSKSKKVSKKLRRSKGKTYRNRKN
jgi:arsenate reductase-like glutaredoxin family protein